MSSECVRRKAAIRCEAFLQRENRISLDNNAVSSHFAPKFAAAFRQLARIKLRLAQPLGPVGRQRAMRRASHGIFRDAIAGRKITRDEITLLSRRRDRDSERMKLFQSREIRPDILDRSLVFVHRNVNVIRVQQMRWSRPWPQALDEGFRQRCARFCGHCWEIHCQLFSVLADSQRSAETRLEPNRLEPRLQQIKQHVGGGQGCVAAEPDLATRGKPSQVITFAPGHEKGGFGKVILGGDLEQQLVI